jgi:hypothetical protein
MGYDDVKDFEGRPYSGMSVGGTHDWDYPDGRWIERKVAPDRWKVNFTSSKRRRRAAPEGSGAAPGTKFHWFLVGHQRVRKVDEDTYQTLFEATKWKVGHRRPHWRKWSSEYPEQTPARDRVIAILEETLAELRADKERGAPPVEAALAPVPGEPAYRRPAQARLPWESRERTLTED